MKTRIGIIGCGNISPLYLKGKEYFSNLEYYALSDIDMDLARQRAEEFGIKKVMSVDELLADNDVDLILNLTVPNVHAEISKKALLAGKHVYSEKPISTDLGDAGELLEIAKKANKRLAVAPSTFLGATVQTARKAIDDGLIGEVVAANCFFLSHGMESWHPNPEFFYQPGAGPLLDMGPYYLAALIAILGPVKRVSAVSKIGLASRAPASGPNAGKSFKVNTPTHISTNLEFADGPIANLNTSFDVWHSELPKFEIYGTKGSLSLGAPNSFEAEVRIRKDTDDEWRALEFVAPAKTLEEGWCVALADFVSSIENGTEHRASAQIGLHLFEIMQASLVSAKEAKFIDIKSSCARPKPIY